MRNRVDQGARGIQSDFRMNPWQNHKLLRLGHAANRLHRERPSDGSVTLGQKLLRISQLFKPLTGLQACIGAKATLRHKLN